MLATAFSGGEVGLTALVSLLSFFVVGGALIDEGVLGIALTQLASFALPPLLLAQRKTGGWHALGTQRPSLALPFVAAALIALGMWCWNAMWVAPLTIDWSPFQDQSAWTARLAIESRPLWLSILLLALVPALCEELLHRGLFLPFFVRKLGPATGLAFGALVFGLSHFSAARLVPTAIVGVFAGLARMRSGNLWPAVLLHGLYNSCLLAVSYIDLPLAPWYPIPALGISGIGLVVLLKLPKSDENIIRNG